MVSEVPRSLTVPANGLEHHVLEWDAALEAGARPARAETVTALLLHGFMDAAATWDLVAPRLAEGGLRVLAPDLRGFGDGPRIPRGGYYYFPDYVLDVAEIVEALVPPGAPLLVVGHSMGGSVATLFAGCFPERVTKLVVVEGIGPPDSDHAHSVDRMHRWIDEVRGVRVRGEKSMASRDEALRRLAGNHPRVDRAVLETRLDALARPLGEGRLAWKADPLHGTRSPTPFFSESFKSFARRVTCPVLFVSGGPLGWHPPDEDARLAAFVHLERIEIEDAGHMMHWSRPEELSRAVVRFASAAQ
jgi:pimeloyl-ACP methyl ester carboxylesterase